MQAAFYVKQGPAREVLEVGARPTPEPGPGEVRVRLRSSGVHIGYAEGACFGIPALTALQAVRLAELSPASTVLIVGGGGSVAHYHPICEDARRACHYYRQQT
jgi:NADPH:quinone reductase-like Zn-dependent oxidoreductase